MSLSSQKDLVAISSQVRTVLRIENRLSEVNFLWEFTMNGKNANLTMTPPPQKNLEKHFSTVQGTLQYCVCGYKNEKD